MKKVIIFALVFTNIEMTNFNISAVTPKREANEEFTIEDYDERYLLKTFKLTTNTYNDVIDEYLLSKDIKDFWITPYPNVNMLEVITKKTLYSREYFEFLPKLFPFIKQLVIKNTYIENETFLYLVNQYKKQVTELDLSGCNISINSSLLINLEKLQKLNISGNNISSLGFLTKNITHLDISSNPLKKEQILNIYKKSPNLQELTLNKDILNTNEIKKLWSNLKGLISLKIGAETFTRFRTLQHSV